MSLGWHRGSLWVLCWILLSAPSALATEPFSQNACWDEACPEEVAACETNPVCSLIAQCIQSGGAVLACYQEYGSQSAADLYTAIQECGWAACATNEGSCQGVCSYFGPTSCNCDPLCEQYGDCCGDYWELCWKEAQPCEPTCAQKTCGADGCGGSCGSCPPNAACDTSGQCNDQCEDVCALGESGCQGDVRWTCTPGLGGCPKKSTVDCTGAQMICDHGECLMPQAPPDAGSSGTADVSSEDTLSPSASDVGPGGDLGDEATGAFLDLPAPPSMEDADSFEAPDPSASTLSETQTASAPRVVREGCGGAPRSAPLWTLSLALLALRCRGCSHTGVISSLP